uniref:Uncharacterized protein n=1 Tax=Siphoviridae sp. ctyvQ1 TaxID=2826525 RepID=A0A8S5QZI1_9CAUD|nr:MAG TPA: hypothetical protein [Siphoviridae sp. ctyvQ1]
MTVTIRLFKEYLSIFLLNCQECNLLQFGYKIK